MRGRLGGTRVEISDHRYLLRLRTRYYWPRYQLAAEQNHQIAPPHSSPNADGIVASMSRPGGNLTWESILTSEVNAKHSKACRTHGAGAGIRDPVNPKKNSSLA